MQFLPERTMSRFVHKIFAIRLSIAVAEKANKCINLRVFEVWVSYSSWRKIAYSITHSLTHPAYWMFWQPKRLGLQRKRCIYIVYLFWSRVKY